MENPKLTKFLAFCQNDGLFSAFYALQKQTLSIKVWKLREFQIFNFETIILNLEKVFSNLEPEGQGDGIVMGVTRPLLLGPFYYIQTEFSILFCTRLYSRAETIRGNTVGLVNFIEPKIIQSHYIETDRQNFRHSLFLPNSFIARKQLLYIIVATYVSENSAWEKTAGNFYLVQGSMYFQILVFLSETPMMCAICELDLGCIPCTYIPYTAKYTPSMVGFIYQGVGRKNDLS